MVLPEEVGADAGGKRCREQFNAAFYALFTQLEKEGMLKPDLDHNHSPFRLIQSVVLFLSGLVVNTWLGSTSTVWYDVGLVLIVLGLGQMFLLKYEASHGNAFSASSREGINRIFQIFSFGFMYGLTASASCDNAHEEERGDGNNQQAPEENVAQPERKNDDHAILRWNNVINQDVLNNLRNRQEYAP